MAEVCLSNGEQLELERLCELKFGNGEYTLGETDGETIKAELLENLVEVLYMSVYIRTIDLNVVNVDKT